LTEPSKKAVAIRAAIRGLSALVLSGQLGGVLDQPDRVAQLEATVVDLIECGLERPRAARSTCGHQDSCREERMGDRLKEKVALVSGAGSSGPGWGNGKATAVLFAREGARVLAADINLDAAVETKRIIEREGGICEAVAGNVSLAENVAAMVDACIAAFGRIDVLHNNVGIVEVGGPVETTEDSWDRVNDVNLKSMFLTCRQVLPHMERQGKGAIVNIASVSGIRWLGVPYISYAATKAAVIQFTRVIALQYARSGIRANSILPGMMNTPMVHAAGVVAAYGGSAEEMVRRRDEQCPMGRMGDAWDVAYAALFLASDEAKYITGAELVVDGGLTVNCV
jgi:NAD(P)-dependent dehydrogenase (short-subunit alcohol dehydrogenase family)